jgi:23S rRNA (uracil1939-C5)-methyltransferase
VGWAGEPFLQNGFPRAPFQKSSATLQITVVVNGKDLPRKEKLIETLRERFGGDFSLWVNRVAANIDPVREKNRKDCAERFRGGSDRAAASGAAITGKEYAHVGGAEYLPAMVFGLRLNLHPAAFFQVNDEIAAALFQAVSETVKAAGVKTVIDAYCGAGLLTCVLGKFCERAVGIEISPEAVAAARRLASENGMTNAEFIEGDCGAVLPRLLRGGNARCSTRNAQINARCSTRDSRLNDGNQNTETALILDPPRAGCPPSVINAILSNPPALVCYISCGPATLARDLSALKERYAVQSVRPFDMFPQTPHVETLCVLARDKF